MKKIVTLVLILILFTIGFIAVKTSKTTGNAASEQIRDISIDAVRYKYTPELIEINKGERVRININNIDTLHGIRIPEFNVKGENSVEFTANKTGEFEFYCTVYCGDQHKEMKGKIIVKW